MANPKKRMTSTRSGNRRSHHALRAQSLAVCPNCNQAVRTHRVCPNCGQYKGKTIIKK